MKRFFLTNVVLVIAFFYAMPDVAWSHAFPEHAEPGAGAALTTVLTQVQIRFDRELEPVFSTLRVEDGKGMRVDNGDSHLVPGQSSLLQVSLKPLTAGVYHVFWTAVARDGHRTEGDYTFTVKELSLAID